MPKILCPHCQSALTLHWIDESYEVSTDLPENLKAGALESLARCFPCQRSYLLHAVITITQLPEAKIKA